MYHDDIPRLIHIIDWYTASLQQLCLVTSEDEFCSERDVLNKEMQHRTRCMPMQQEVMECVTKTQCVSACVEMLQDNVRIMRRFICMQW